MSEYIIKTDRDRNLVIEADRYNYNATEETYEFFKKDDKADIQKVATIPNRAFLAIVESEAEKADFYEHYDVNEEEDDTEEVCPGCQYADLLVSDAFFEAVANIIDCYHNPAHQEDTPPEAIQPVPVAQAAIPDVPKEEYPVEHWKDEDGKDWWGFHTSKGFVNFIKKKHAEEGRESQIVNPDSLWVYLDLSKAIKVED